MPSPNAFGRVTAADISLWMLIAVTTSTTSNSVSMPGPCRGARIPFAHWQPMPGVRPVANLFVDFFEFVLGDFPFYGDTPRDTPISPA